MYIYGQFLNEHGEFTPPYLKPGDTVGIIAPARFVSHEDVNPAPVSVLLGVL